MSGSRSREPEEEQQKPAPEANYSPVGGAGVDAPELYERPSTGLTRRGKPRLSREERAAINAKNRRTHGFSRHDLYETWRGMLRRVDTRPSYLEAGIDVDPRWRDVAVFVEDIESGLGPGRSGDTLDREDNDAGYWIWNVRWATPLQQARNRGHVPVDGTSKADICLLTEGSAAREYCCFVRACQACPVEQWR